MILVFSVFDFLLDRPLVRRDPSLILCFVPHCPLVQNPKVEPFSPDAVWQDWAVKRIVFEGQHRNREPIIFIIYNNIIKKPAIWMNIYGFSTNGTSWHICIGIKKLSKKGFRINSKIRISDWLITGISWILPLIVNSYYQWSVDMQLNIDRQENLFRRFSNEPRLILEQFPMRLQILMQPTYENDHLFLQG